MRHRETLAGDFTCVWVELLDQVGEELALPHKKQSVLTRALIRLDRELTNGKLLAEELEQVRAYDEHYEETENWLVASR